tara:strand:+ start:24 stop:191 length:168 start_codon:yes stop_codon:yes gene_type:complete
MAMCKACNYILEDNKEHELCALCALASKAAKYPNLLLNEQDVDELIEAMEVQTRN